MSKTDVWREGYLPDFIGVLRRRLELLADEPESPEKFDARMNEILTLIDVFEEDTKDKLLVGWSVAYPD
jgi:hypothetical protein